MRLAGYLMYVRNYDKVRPKAHQMMHTTNADKDKVRSTTYCSYIASWLSVTM